MRNKRLLDIPGTVGFLLGQGGAKKGNQVGIPSFVLTQGASGFLRGRKSFLCWGLADLRLEEGSGQLGVGRSRAKSLGEATGSWAREMGSQEVGRGNLGGNGGLMAVWALEGVGSGNSGRGSQRERRDIREEDVPLWIFLL